MSKAGDSKRGSGDPAEGAAEDDVAAAEAAAASTRDEGAAEDEDAGDTCEESETGEVGHSEDSADGEGAVGAETVDEDADASVADERDEREGARVVLGVVRDLLERRAGDRVRGTMVARGWRPK